MMEANNERVYDDYERLAVQAFMVEKAHRAKRLKLADLFERPTDSKSREEKPIEERRKEVDEINEWLATLKVERKG